jgi:hypothetical protein
VLGGALGAAALGLSGIALARPAAAHGEIVSYPGISGAETVYEVTGDLAGFGYRPSFHDRLNSWLDFWEANTPDSFGVVHRVWTYGAHTDSRVSEAHNEGRGFDLSRLVTIKDGVTTRRFFARRDIWMNWSDADRAAERRRYWATAASAHHHFRNVLTYEYNADHNNHIHIDNLVSGLGNSDLDTGSTAQVQHVQACCRYVWGLDTTIDGVWGSQTASHSTRVLRAAGIDSGGIATSQANWLAFNRHTTRKGYFTQSYPNP